jgi:alkylhydroperoxidase/carboxymuconolactone decarboxylase family protein YurZ
LKRRANPWQVFVDEKPEVAKAYLELMKHVNENNVLDKKTISLIYVGIYSAIREAGALRHFISEAFKAGATKEEVEAATLLAFGIGVSSAELSLQIILECVKRNEG